MQRPRFKVLRFMALAAMILSLSGVFGLMPAATAEEGSGTPAATTDLPADSGEGTTAPEGDTGDGSSEGDSTGADPVVTDGGEGTTDGGEPVVTEGSEPVVTESTANRQVAPAGDDGVVAPQAFGDVSGRVRDAETGAALPGATVTLVQTGASTTTDGDGRYVFDAGPLSSFRTYNVSVSMPGYVSGGESLYFIGLVTDVFPTVYLTPIMGYMTVFVYDAGGNVIPDATVTFTSILESGPVNPDGTFTTSTTYPVGTYEFTASAPGYGDVTSTIAVSTGNASTIVNLNRTVLDAVLSVDPAIDGTYAGSCGGAPVSGDFFGGTAVMGQVYDGAYCEVTLSAPNYENGSAAGYITTENNVIAGALGSELSADGVTFAVIGEDDGSLEGAPMLVTDSEGGEVFNGTVPASGGVLTSSLTPGEYTVTVGQFGPYAGATEIFTITADDDGETFTTEVPLMVVLDAYLFVEPAVDGTYEGTCAGVPVSGEFVDGQALMGQVYEGAACEVTLSADNFEDGSASGTITDEDDNGSGFIAGTLGAAIPTAFPVTLTVLPSDGGDASGAFWAVFDNVNPNAIASGMFDGSNTVDVGVLENGTYTVHVDGSPIGYTFAAGPYSVDGGPAAWGIAIDPIPEYDVWVNVDPDVVAYFQVYDVNGEIVGEGQPFDFSTGDAYIGTLPDGDYTLLVDAEGYAFYSESFTIDGAARTVQAILTPLDAPTYPISGIVTDLETGDPIAGAEIFVELFGDDDAGDVSIMALVSSTTTDENGEYSISVPDGTYDVYVVADGYYSEYTTITVDGDGQIRDFQLEPFEEWTTGFLEVQKFYCDDVDTVSFNAGVADDDCDTGAAYFTIYMYGDGTADYVPLHVWESGWGYIELEEGTYTLVEEGSNAKYDFEIVAGDWTYVEVVNPGEAPAPRDGRVNVSTFLCNNISETIFTSDAPGVLMAAAGLPTFEPACDPVKTDVTFYLVGDGTADYWQVTTKGGKGTIVLAPGTYEVVEERTQARYFIEVIAGDFISLDIQIPAGGEVTDGTSINISKFYCDTLTEVEWLSLTDAEYSDREELHGAPKCRPGVATFTFYLYGDGTDAYAQIKVYGAGSIGLAPGSYLVVEEETQATFDLEVLEGENTLLRVNNPMPDDGEYPGKPDYDKDKKHHKKHGKDKKSTTKTVEVTKLPETGAGSSESTDALAMAVAAAAMAAGAGALRLRKDN